jgi:4-amino-4-deoxy-L-arabinose transferase-like glycosyltransferase
MIIKPQNTQERRGLYTLIFLLIARLIGMVTIPLNDVTEARYGEIARKMLETGNWVTPLHDYGVPFLAKPPMWAWLSALSMGAFGVNEFAARLPSLILSIFTIALTAYTAFRQSGREAALTATLVLAGSFGFFVVSGTVMTDAALTFSTTLILCAFWLAFRHGEKYWGWVFFAGCGIALLVKGPFACIIPGLPVFFWTLYRREWKHLWQRLPWIRGTALTLAIAVPWYVLAEIRTPGFLKYFIIGEHIDRFLDKNWNGDKYGYAHAYPYGMIWIFAAACLLPWCLLLPTALRTLKKTRDDDGWIVFTALWGMANLVFFTAAANIIWPYPVPVLPGFALLLAALLPSIRNRIPAFAATVGVLGLIAVGATFVLPQKLDNSEKDIIAIWHAQKPEQNSHLIFWGYGQEFSAAFYSAGRAKSTFNADIAENLLKNETQDYIVSTPYGLDHLPPDVRKHFEEIGRYKNGRGIRILLREKVIPPLLSPAPSAPSPRQEY